SSSLLYGGLLLGLCHDEENHSNDNHSSTNHPRQNVSTLLRLRLLFRLLRRLGLLTGLSPFLCLYAGHQHHRRERRQGDGSLSVVYRNIQHFYVKVHHGVVKIGVYHLKRGITVLNVAHKVQRNQIAALVDTI